MGTSSRNYKVFALILGNALLVLAIFLETSFRPEAVIVFSSYFVISSILSRYIESPGSLFHITVSLLVLSIVIYNRLIGDTRNIHIDIAVLSTYMAVTTAREIYHEARKRRQTNKPKP